MRELFPDVDVDTCHGAFLLHKPETEAWPHMTEYDLVVVDEVSQLSRDQFERIVRMWHQADKVPALIFLGDFYQLPGVEPTRANESPAWKKIYKVELVDPQRCKDKKLWKKIMATRTARPSMTQLKDIVRNHKAWSGKKPNQLDIRNLLRRTKSKTTIVTCTRKAANKINNLVVGILFCRSTKLAEIPSHFDANPENYDENNQLRKDRRPIPKMMRIYKGMRIFLTNNLNKKEDFVNGMEATIEDYDDQRKCLTVRTRTNKRLAVWLYTDPDPTYQRVTYFPIRYGYASTLHKVQGATLDHATIWLDIPNMRGAGHVALSRVRRDSDYLIGGDVGPEHFTPAM